MTNRTLIDKMNRASIIVWYIFETDKKMYVAFHVSLNSTNSTQKYVIMLLFYYCYKTRYDATSKAEFRFRPIMANQIL